MINLNDQYKEKVIKALFDQRGNFDGTDQQFGKKYSIPASTLSRLKKGERKGLLRDVQYMNLGRELNVFLNEQKWKLARTKVYSAIEEDVTFCKEFSKPLMCADDCGIGKTETAKHLSRTLKNCFYVDAKQAKTKQLFVKLIAKTLGVDIDGKYADIKANLKYYVHLLEKPIIIVDDAGYLEYNAHMELLELIDATAGICGWYQIGDDSLQEKVKRGINSKKVGYRAMFSRFGKRYTTIVPAGKEDKISFYKELITEVITAQAVPGIDVNKIVLKCLVTDNSDIIGDLRRVQPLLILNTPS